MFDPDEFLRLRLDRDAPRVPRPDLGGSGSPAFVGRVTTTGTTSANHYVNVNPVTLTGAETEGGSGTLTVDTGVTMKVLFLGPGTTTVGDDLVVRWGDYRWLAVKKTASSSTVALSGCPCTATPTTIVLTVNSQPGTATFDPCTLVYGPTPSAWVVAVGAADSFLSVETFTDAFGEAYKWHIRCFTNFYALRRFNTTTGGGSGSLDSVRYSWPHSSPDNTCSPTWALRKGNNTVNGGTGTSLTAIYADPGP